MQFNLFYLKETATKQIRNIISGWGTFVNEIKQYKNGGDCTVEILG